MFRSELLRGPSRVELSRMRESENTPQSLMRSQGMTDGENYRDLLTRLSTALAMTEAAYLEARRRRDH
jgi:hypothetical protein